jgi:hypothetical protein
MNKTPAARSAKGAAVLKAREKSGKTQRSKRSRDRTKATGRPQEEDVSPRTKTTGLETRCSRR